MFPFSIGVAFRSYRKGNFSACPVFRLCDGLPDFLKVSCGKVQLCFELSVCDIQTLVKRYVRGFLCALVCLEIDLLFKMKHLCRDRPGKHLDRLVVGSDSIVVSFAFG